LRVTSAVGGGERRGRDGDVMPAPGQDRAPVGSYLNPGLGVTHESRLLAAVASSGYAVTVGKAAAAAATCRPPSCARSAQGLSPLPASLLTGTRRARARRRGSGGSRRGGTRRRLRGW